MKAILCAVLTFACMSLLAGCQKGGTNQTSIQIVPKQALVDERVSVRVVGLRPNENVTLHAGYTDCTNQVWESHADFMADGSGVVDPGSQAAVAGTYKGIDPSGLFWSMEPVQQEKQASPLSNCLQPTTVTFTADAAGKQVASGDFERLSVAPSVIRRTVHEDGLAGTLFLPGETGRYPGVIVLSGSNGGVSESRAALLASHGFAAFALAYFAYDDLPKELVNIPLEYFEHGIHWMQKQEGVAGDRLAVMGGSRGGELVLLLGSKFPEIKAVVALSPGGIIWSGVAEDEKAPPQPAWTYKGKPLPFVSWDETQVEKLERADKAAGAQEPIRYTPIFLKQMSNVAAVKKAAIEVEKINGPVLMVSGDDDQIWPSSLLSEMVMKRLAEHKHPFPDNHLSYPGAGHVFGVPNLPTTVDRMLHPIVHVEIAFGGNAKDNAAAASDSWPRVLTFLQDSLKEGGTK